MVVRNSSPFRGSGMFKMVCSGSGIYRSHKYFRLNFRIISSNGLFLSRHYIPQTKMSFVNKRNPNVEQYFPHQEPAIGAAYSAVCFIPSAKDPRAPDRESLLPVRFLPK